MECGLLDQVQKVGNNVLTPLQLFEKMVLQVAEDKKTVSYCLSSVAELVAKKIVSERIKVLGTLLPFYEYIY